MQLFASVHAGRRFVFLASLHMCVNKLLGVRADVPLDGAPHGRLARIRPQAAHRADLLPQVAQSLPVHGGDVRHTGKVAVLVLGLLQRLGEALEVFVALGVAGPLRGTLPRRPGFGRDDLRLIYQAC